MTDKTTGIADAGGITTIISGLIMSAWNLFSKDPINSSIVILTAIGGLIYLFYKIRNERKKSKLLDLEIKVQEKELK